jgi:hypothetical protein
MVLCTCCTFLWKIAVRRSGDADQLFLIGVTNGSGGWGRLHLKGYEQKGLTEKKKYFMCYFVLEFQYSTCACDPYTSSLHASPAGPQVLNDAKNSPLPGS